MEEPKNKLRADFDIILAGNGRDLNLGREFTNEINLKNIPSQESHQEVDEERIELESQGPGVDDQMSKILEGSVDQDAKHVIEEMMSMTSDPVVELARAGAEVFGIHKKFKPQAVAITYYGQNIEKPEFREDYY